jgi:hypothetical protein
MGIARAVQRQQGRGRGRGRRRGPLGAFITPQPQRPLMSSNPALTFTKQLHKVQRGKRGLRGRGVNRAALQGTLQNILPGNAHVPNPQAKRPKLSPLEKHRHGRRPKPQPTSLQRQVSTARNRPFKTDQDGDVIFADISELVNTQKQPVVQPTDGAVDQANTARTSEVIGRIVFGCMKRINHDFSPVIRNDKLVARWCEQIQRRHIAVALRNFETLLQLGAETVALSKVQRCRKKLINEKYVPAIVGDVEGAFNVLKAELQQDVGPAGLRTLRIRPSPGSLLHITSAVNPGQAVTADPYAHLFPLPLPQPHRTRSPPRHNLFTQLLIPPSRTKPDPLSVLPLSSHHIQGLPQQIKSTWLDTSLDLHQDYKPTALPLPSERNIFWHLEHNHHLGPYRLPSSQGRILSHGDVGQLLYTQNEIIQVSNNLKRFEEQNAALKQQQDPPHSPSAAILSIVEKPAEETAGALPSLPLEQPQDTVASAPAVVIPSIVIHEADDNQLTSADQNLEPPTSTTHSTESVAFSIATQPVAGVPHTPASPAPPAPEMASSNQLLRRFLGVLDNVINTGNGGGLQELLPIEPPFNSDYIHMLEEISSSFSDPQVLQEFIRDRINVSGGDDPDAWYAFPDFIVNYFNFIRDVNVENLLETYEMLSNLIT